MIIDNKKNILIYGATFFIIFVVLISFLAFKKNNQKKNRNLVIENSDVPKVLGATFDLRGPEKNFEKSKFIKTGDLDFSKISAKSFLAFNAKDGQVLAEKLINEKNSIASLTKLLTALVVYENTDLESDIEIQQSDIVNVNPILKLKAGDKIKTIDLLNSMLVGSCNDAALALANFVAKKTGRDFVALMNEKARELKMTNSNFSNPIGFDSKENFSTANDLSRLITVLEQLNVFKNTGKKTKYEFMSENGNLYFIKSTNKLIKKYNDLEAIKTGYTVNSLGSMITRLNFQNEQIILIVLNSQNRENDTVQLKDLIKMNFILKQF